MFKLLLLYRGCIVVSQLYICDSIVVHNMFYLVPNIFFTCTYICCCNINFPSRPESFAPLTLQSFLSWVISWDRVKTPHTLHFDGGRQGCLQGILGHTPPAYINSRPEGFQSKHFYKPDVQPTVTEHWRNGGNYVTVTCIISVY